MLNTPKYYTLITILCLSYSSLFSNTVISNSGATFEYGSIFTDNYTSDMNTALKSAAIITEIGADEGIRTVADFDWETVNVIDSPEYFQVSDNFFNDFRRNAGINYDSTIHGFLNAKKANIVSKDVGRQKLSFTNLPKHTQKLVNGIIAYDIFTDPLTYNLSGGESFTGMGAGTGNGAEKFEIRGGTTTTARNVTFQLREKTPFESYGAQTDPNIGDHYTNDKLIGHSPLVGGVMRLHGMGILEEAAADGRVKTDPFALEGTYTQADFDATYSLSELEELINGCLFLGWLNTAIDGNPDDITDGDRWVHAIQGNFDNMPDNPNRHDFYGRIGNPIIGSLDEYLAGTVTSIPGLTKASGEMRVGDHGGSGRDNTVWAILDHNSDFAVVPEPSTYALVAGVLSLAFVAFKRRN